MVTTHENTTLNILLADDDADDRFFFERALNELPIVFKLKMVNDGERLMDYLYKNVADLPDVLFLDNNMPRKNGSECLVEIKNNEQLKGIPIIICSTSLGDDFANTLYQGGAHYYLHKCDFEDLTKCIHSILKLLAINPAQPPRNQFMFSLQQAQT